MLYYATNVVIYIFTYRVTKSYSKINTHLCFIIIDSESALHYLSFVGFCCKRRLITKIYIDNKYAQELAKNLMFHKRTKHIDIRHHFIRKCMAMKEVELIYM